MGRIRRVVLIIIGIMLNVLSAFVMNKLGLPLFFDTMGTIAVSALCGMFPGIITAILTNIFCMSFNPYSMYFAFINASVAVFTSYYTSRYSLKKPGRFAVFVVSAAVFAGISSSVVQWFLFKGAQHDLLADMANGISEATEISVFNASVITNVFLNILDKGIVSLIVLGLLAVIPRKFIDSIREVDWKQRPLSEEEKESIKLFKKKVRHSIESRIYFTLILICVWILIVVGIVGYKIFYDNEKAEKETSAWNAARFAARIIDGDMIDEYIRLGEDAPGYKETRDMMYNIWETAGGIKYLYAHTVEGDECVFVFDLDVPGEEEMYLPGDVEPVGEDFIPYMDDFKNGNEVGPIEVSTFFSHIFSVYTPVFDSKGNVACYVGADVSIDYLFNSIIEYVYKIGFILAGFIILFLAGGIKYTRYLTAYPISTITQCLDGFVNDDDSQEQLDLNVKRLRRLNIKTGDEVERLYQTLCSLTVDQAETLRDVRRLSESTALMQDGLIITMANMVESRDSDTGEHVQKTAEYVRIIAEGLRDKGYYPEKMTPKFISDVVRSAPLHDVGKINISDKILNKPGKLTDEEYEIMKTHTTSGKEIMEHAISTVQGGSYLKEARNMAGYHHERWDGKGYPEGLHGEVIPLAARIMSVADVFDALTSRRIYKPPFPLDQALDILRQGAGTQFDPKCVEVFIDALPEVKKVLRKYNQDV